MKRELTAREKTLLLVLAVLVIVLGYYKLIYEPITNQISVCRDNTQQEQLELDDALIRAAQMKKMEDALPELRQKSGGKAIPQYDNSEMLMLELRRTLAGTQDYSLDFSPGTTTQGYLVLRPISLAFQTATYAQAREIIDALSDSAYMNRISDLSIQTDRNNNGLIQTSLVITYFEIMA